MVFLWVSSYTICFLIGHSLKKSFSLTFYWWGWYPHPSQWYFSEWVPTLRVFSMGVPQWVFPFNLLLIGIISFGESFPSTFCWQWWCSLTNPFLQPFVDGIPKEVLPIDFPINPLASLFYLSFVDSLIPPKSFFLLSPFWWWQSPNH